MNKAFLLSILLLNTYSINCIENYNDFMLKAYKRINNIGNEQQNLIEAENIINQYYTLNDVSSETFINVLDDLLSYPFPNISENCLKQTSEFLDALKSNETWSYQVIDSFGKPGSGILLGNVNFNGMFSQCLNISGVNTNTEWKGEYCSLQLQPLNIIPGIPLVPKFGLCIPNECNSHDIVEILNYGINTLNISSNITSLKNLTDKNISCYEPAEIDSGAIFAIIVISILVAFTIIGTTYDIYKQKYFVPKQSEEKSVNLEGESKVPLFLQISLCFSLYTNLRKLFTVKKGGDQLDCIHCIRFLSMGWVVLGHTFAFSSLGSANAVTVFGWVPRFTMQMIANAFFSVDSFFMLSGLLNSYLFLKSIEKSNFQLSIPLFIKYYVHRLWRITPPYMLTVMFTACLTKYLGSGPNYPTKDGLDGNCRTYWWANLLYINNIVDVDHMCFGIAWYLANDMQFYFIAPIMLIPFAMGFRKKLYTYIAYGISGFLLFLNMLIVALLLLSKPGSETGTLGTQSPWYQKNIYFTPWCRIGAFIIGILTGYIIYKCKKNPSFKLNNALNMIGWYLAIFSMALMLWGVWGNLSYIPNNHLNKAENILYQSSSRIIWSIGLGWIIFSCVMGKGGFMNDFFCWSIWTPLSRLSFSAYLIHFDVIYWYNLQQEKMIFQSQYNLAYEYIGHMVITYMASLVVNQLFEVPLLGLEKFIFGKKK